jgi:hypothetical protein
MAEYANDLSDLRATAARLTNQISRHLSLVPGGQKALHCRTSVMSGDCRYEVLSSDLLRGNGRRIIRRGRGKHEAQNTFFPIFRNSPTTHFPEP